MGLIDDIVLYSIIVFYDTAYCQILNIHLIILKVTGAIGI